MRTVFSQAAARAAGVPITLAISVLLWVFAPEQVSAGFCSRTNCSLALSNSDVIGSDNFGTVTLALSSNTVTIDVNLATSYRIIKIGFPGAVGSADDSGGGRTLGNFDTGDMPTSLYSGYQSLTEADPWLHHQRWRLEPPWVRE